MTSWSLDGFGRVERFSLLPGALDEIDSYVVLETGDREIYLGGLGGRDELDELIPRHLVTY